MEQVPQFLENGKCVQLNGGSQCSDDCNDGSEHYKKYLLDTDQFFDELSDRVTVSCMVNDSVIKGIVKAVSEEANDVILAKDAEIANLHEELSRREAELLKLQRLLQVKGIENGSVEAVIGGGSRVPNELANLFLMRNVDQDANDALVQSVAIQAKAQFRRVMKEMEDVRILVSTALTETSILNNGSMDNELSSTSDSGWTSLAETKRHSDDDVNAGSELKNISSKVVKMENELHSLKDILNNSLFLSKSTLLESQWMCEVQDAVSTIVLQGFIENIQQHYAEEAQEEQFINAQRNVWLSQQNAISYLREELDNISQCLFGFDLGHTFLHGSHEDHDQVANGPKRVQQKVLGNHLLPGHQEQKASVYSSSNGASIEISDFSHLKHLKKDELINYFRTEIIKMSRNHESQLHAATEECFRLKRELLKDKGSVHIRKDKDLDVLKKRIIEVMSKLDDIIKQNSVSSLIFDDNRRIHGVMNQMIKENQNLKNVLTDKKKEIRSLSLQLTDAKQRVSLQHSAELNLLKQIRKFKSDMEENELELLLRDHVHKAVLKELMLGHQCEINDSDLEIIAMHEFCKCILEEALKDAEVIMNSTTAKYSEEKQLRCYFETLAEEGKQSVCSEITGKELLKGKIVLLSAMLEEKEQWELEAKSTLVRQKEDLEVVSHELNELRLQSLQQERQIMYMNHELDTLRGSHDSALQQVANFSVDLKELQQRLSVALNDLSEAHKDRVNLEKVLQEEEHLVSMFLQREKEQKEQWEVVSSCILDCSKEMLEFEQRVAAMISLNDSRFQKLHAVLCPLIQHCRVLSRRGLWCKRILSDLQTAEAEVDLLGDEVDGLLSLLEKIYFALDHYSPVLKYYPGIMEILKLVRRELSGEKSSSQSPLAYQHASGFAEISMSSD